jgi:hypothetical protein
MGLGLNFVCNCCNYDSGLLMLAQGANHPIQAIIEKFLDTYSNELDLHMLPYRMDLYKMILTYVSSHPEEESTYYYHGCVCHGCNRTYEMLDIFKRKEEEVYVGDRFSAQGTNPLPEILGISETRWSSLIGEEPLCLFCDQHIIKLTEQILNEGVSCPKCKTGVLQVGNEFQLWD